MIHRFEEQSNSNGHFVAWFVAISLIICTSLVLLHKFTWMSGVSTDQYALIWVSLVAASLGFGAVIFQTRSSYQQLREQMADQHRTASEELGRQKRAIAAALLAAVTDFRKYYIEPFICRDEEAETVKFLDRKFAVYEANTGRIGDLDMKACEAIVHFYDRASEHVAACNRYQEIAVGPPGQGESEESKKRRETKFFAEHLGERRLATLKELANEVERMLAQDLKAGS